MISSQQKILIAIFLTVSAISNLTLLFLTVNANLSRKRARSERQEILCVLKIPPEERNKYPEKMEACAKGV